MPPTANPSTSTTSSAIPSATSASSSSSQSSTALALGISLAVVACLVFGCLTIYFVRKHLARQKTKGRPQEVTANRWTYMVSVDPTHLAARVTPFGVGVNAPDVEVPKFVHHPGENMRVAFRRSDGGWEFAHNANPSGSVDLHREDTISTLAMMSRPQGTKEKKLRPGELTTRGYVESDVDGNPPPAYYYHEESVLSDNTAGA